MIDRVLMPLFVQVMVATTLASSTNALAQPISIVVWPKFFRYFLAWKISRGPIGRNASDISECVEEGDAGDQAHPLKTRPVNRHDTN